MCIRDSSGRGHVIDKQDRTPAQAGPLPVERPLDVVLAPAAVVAHLRRRGACADEPAGRRLQRHSRSDLARQKLGLVEPAHAKSIAVKGDRNHPRCRKSFHSQALDQDQRQWLGQAAPAAVLEPLDRQLDGTFVSDSGPQPR